VKPTSVAILLRAVALAEACSWVGLLFGMFVKWVLGSSEAGVQLFGPVHGGIFIGYVVATSVAARVLRWDATTTVLGLAASVPPLATLWFDRWATGTGRLPVPEPVGPS
jgi:integral membrane protein